MRVLVVEDEEIIGRRLARLLKSILGDRLTAVRQAATLSAALDRIAEEPIDLLLLDLNLHGSDGFDLLEEAVAGRFQTIIVSAQHDQALRAFEYGVTDFVPKPFDEARLRAAVDRATNPDRSRHPVKLLMVRSHHGLVPIPIESIRYIEGAGDYARLHLENGKRHLHDKTLKGLEQQLPRGWHRLHRSYLVDTRRVVRYRSEPGSRYFAVLRGGTGLPVSRAFMRSLKQRD